MARSQWHKFYASTVAAPPGLLFSLLADLPNYGEWLPGSDAFGHTTDVEPYPVRYGTRYHDGKPGAPGRDWWGTVTGFQPPGSLDFHHTISVTQLRATVDVRIHYSLEPRDEATQVTRWLVLDVAMPAIFRPLRRLITASFDKENLRTMAALQRYAEARHPERAPGGNDPASLRSHLVLDAAGVHPVRGDEYVQEMGIQFPGPARAGTSAQPQPDWRQSRIPRHLLRGGQYRNS